LAVGTRGRRLDNEIRSDQPEPPAVHNPQDYHHSNHDQKNLRPGRTGPRHPSGPSRKRVTVKFRCERDVLVEALNTAGRAVSARGGSLPVLAGVRVELQGNDLSITGSDLDLTITAAIEVAGSTDGVTVLPSKLATDIVRVLEPGAVTIEVGEEEAEIT